MLKQLWFPIKNSKRMTYLYIAYNMEMQNNNYLILRLAIQLIWININKKNWNMIIKKDFLNK